METKTEFKLLLDCFKTCDASFWEIMNAFTIENFKKLEDYNEDLLLKTLEEIYDGDNILSIYYIGHACCEWERNADESYPRPFEDFGIKCLEKAVAGGNTKAMLDLALILTYYERYFTSYPISELFYGASFDGDDFAKECFVAECKMLSQLLNKELKFSIFSNKKKKFTTALQWYAQTKYDMLISSEKGDANAQFDYALAMMYNEFFRRDEYKIVELLEKSASHGNEKAAALLEFAKRKFFIFREEDNK